MTFNDLPVYKAKIDEEELGMYLCSLVDTPAIEEGWIAFEKEERICLSIENEEQRMVFGPVMIPEKPIYRVGNSGYEYYLVFDAQTIKDMTEKFLANMKGGTADVNHSFEVEEGVYLHQVLIKDDEKGISPKGFEHLPNGTLFMQYHIENDEVWNKVKSGQLTGFSLAGLFDIVKLRENKIPNNSKMNRLKTLLRAILATLSNVSTDKGVLGYASDGEMPEIGETVMKIAEDGTESTPEDGEYILETKDVLVIKEGKIAEIIPFEEVKEEEEKPLEAETEVIEEKKEEEEEEKKKKVCGEEDAEVEVKEEPSAEEEAPKEDEKDMKIKELEAKIAEKEAEIVEEKAEIESLKAKIAELEEKSQAPSAEEQFKKETKAPSVGDKKMDNLMRVLNA